MFSKLDKHLRILTGNRHLLYGGIHIIFTGDFMQLAPVGGSPIFSRFNDIHWHGSLNAAIFLDQGNHRFNKDPDWGEILKRIQLGVPTSEDLEKMNERLLSLVQLPQSIDFTKTRLVYGCYTNKRRNAITDACFLNFIMNNNPSMESNIEPSDTAILIKSSVSREDSNVGPDFHKLIWSMCGDDNVDAKNNIEKKIVELKPEANSVDISVPSGTSRTKIKGFKICQFAVNLSLATTGHKLQGMTKDVLILSEISLVPNWLYVVL